MNAREGTNAGTTRKSGADSRRRPFFDAMPTDAPPLESAMGWERKPQNVRTNLAVRSSNTLVRFFAGCLTEIKTVK